MAMDQKFYTIIFVVDKSKILLGMKKRGFAQGKWNGFGGKIEDGETKFEAAIRELKEESDLDVVLEDLMEVGTVSCSNGVERRIVYIFSVENFDGSPKESEEMRPEWFDLNEIPYENMWPDSKEWLPICLAGQSFAADFIYDSGWNRIISQNIK